MDTEKKALQIKDLITIGIFSILYVVGIMIAVVVHVTPITSLLYTSVCAILNGSVYMLLIAKIPKRGAILIMSILISLVYLATGHLWTVIVTFVVFGGIAEFITSSKGFKDSKYNAIGYAIFSLGPIGAILPMWIYGAEYAKESIANGAKVEYVEKLLTFATSGVLVAIVIITLIGGFIGAHLGKRIMRKHIEKAGVI